MDKEKLRGYDREYKRKTYKSYTFRYNKESDKELIEFFDSIPDKTKFLKDAIEHAMKKGR